MLARASLVAFAATVDAARSREFYGHTLGLRLVTDDQFAVVFDCNGTQLRIQKVTAVQPPSFTVLGWRVPNIREVVTGLTLRGVMFERYGFMQQDDLGIWLAPSGAKVAWFKDPDGNVLSVTEA